MLNEVPLEGLRQRVLTLRSFEGLERLDVDGLTLMAEYARYRRFSAGAVLQREREAIECIHLVVEGAVEVERKGRHLARIERGAPVGILSVLARDENGVRALAVTDTRTLEVPVEVFLSAYEENFSLTRNALRQAARELLARRHDLPQPPGTEAAPMGRRRERPLTLAEHVIAMRQTPLFARSNVDATLELARHLTPIHLEPGDLLWRVGGLSTYSVRIDYGHLRCRNQTGEEAVVGAGFVAGVLHALADQPRGFSAVADTEVVAYRSELETFLAVLESHFPLAMDLLALLARALIGDPEA